MKTFEVCFEPDRNLKMKKRQLISLCHLLKTTESREGRTCATLLTRGILVQHLVARVRWCAETLEETRERNWETKRVGERFMRWTYAFCRRSSPCARESWRRCCCAGMRDGSPASCRLPERGQGRDCRGPVPAQPTGKTNTARAAITWHTLFSNTQTDTQASMLFSSLFFFWDTVPPPLLLHPFLAFFPRLLSDRLLPAMPYESTDHTPPSPLHLPSMADERCARHNERTAPWVTLITDVTILDGALCPCAAAAILAMVLRWFIWLIAMVTDAGGRLTGIRGWGIIINGSSKPEDERGE